MVDRIGYTCVLGYALVSEIDHAVFIKCYVLEKSVALDRVVDIRLGFFIEVDNFSVAAALEVEYSVVSNPKLIKVVTLNSNRNSNPKPKITIRKGIKKGSHKLPNQHSKK